MHTKSSGFRLTLNEIQEVSFPLNPLAPGKASELQNDIESIVPPVILLLFFTLTESPAQTTCGVHASLPIVIVPEQGVLGTELLH